MAVSEDAKMLMDETAQKEMGLRICQLREERGLSQQDMSELLGKQIRRETIKQWENAERHIKAEDIYMLARFFNVSADYLLGIHDFKVPMADWQGVHNFTGLSEKSISTLLYFKERVPEIIEIFNSVIESDEFGSTMVLLQKVKERTDLLKQRIEMGISTQEELTDFSEDIEFQQFRAAKINEKLVISTLGIDELKEILDEALTNYFKKASTNDK